MSGTKLQNFITPSTPSRADELRCMIRRLKNSATTDEEGAMRQSLTVANISAPTKTRDCLDHLFQLNMVRFLNQWLQEVAKSGDDDAINEQVINASLRSLENIPLFQGKLNSSRIIVIIRESFGHKLVQIKQKIQAFFERWAERSFDVLDCELSVPSSNPLNQFAPIAVSESIGPSELQFIPLNPECELSSRNFAAAGANALLDSEHRENIGEINLNLEIVPPFMSTSIKLSLKNGKTRQLGLTCFEEKEKALTLPKLSSSSQPLIKNFELNDESSAFDSVPAFAFLDSRMITDRRDESSTQALIMGMELSTPSSSHCAPNLDLNLNSGLMENGGNEVESLVRTFMAESGNLLVEGRKNLKRKEPDSGWEPRGFGLSLLRLKL